MKDNTFEIVPYGYKEVFYYKFPYKQPLFSTTFHKIDVEDIVVEKSNFLNATVECAKLINNFDAFDNEVIKAVVQFKWDHLVKHWFQIDFGLTSALAIIYLIHSCAFKSYAVHDFDSVYGVGVTLLALCFDLSVYFAFRELNHLTNAIMSRNPISKAKEYFSDAWNVLHISTCVLTITDLSIRAQQLADSRSTFDDDNYSVILSAFAMPLLAMEVFYYMGALSSFWTFDSNDIVKS